jgi:hypothetical protein
MFYRRLRKKGTQEDQLKKAKKRVVSSSALTRGFAGLSIEQLKAKKDETPERRKAAREADARCFLRPSRCHDLSVSGLVGQGCCAVRSSCIAILFASSRRARPREVEG